MAKRKAKSRARSQRKPAKQSFWERFDVHPDTQRGILAILALALGLITFFSLFGWAGQIGYYLNLVLMNVVGVGRYVIPVLFFIGVYSLMYPTEDRELKSLYVAGLVLLGVSVFGLIDLIQTGAAGYLGLGVTYLFLHFASTSVATVVFLAFLLISILIVFNTSLDHLAQHLPAGTWLGKITRFLVTLFSSARHRLATARATANEAAASAQANVADAEEYYEEVEDEDNEEPVEVEPVVPTPIAPTEPIMSTDTEQMELIQVPKLHRKIDLPLDLLASKKSKPTSGDIERNKSIIIQTLHNFGIDVELGPVSVGPTVTQYSFKPASGVKVSQIVALQNDLALALAAHPIRVEAPIPGKSLVGIELPNITAAQVSLRELLEAKEFKERSSNLSLVFGQDVAGKPFLANLARMPHLLIAGATGSGKSVCINTVLLSLLYQNGPDDLKLILVDPKRVEFTMYNDIPHLLTPVITDAQKTINALKWTVNEMDRRYEVLANAKKRDIAGYNAEHSDDMLPYIVFVIDELADLMITAPREVEAAIVRLAQMARAVGIHLILATQRPSVDVITGLIKANVTSRCAFNTASVVDSRTILDSAGAEKLLGRGDMLYVSAELSKPKRIQGAFVSDQEVLSVVEYLKGKSKADYHADITSRQVSAILPQAFNDGGDEDELLPEAKEMIIKSQKASASLLQRRLRVGYARAARLLDILEEQGFIGPADGAKPREILAVDPEVMPGDEFVASGAMNEEEEETDSTDKSTPNLYNSSEEGE